MGGMEQVVTSSNCTQPNVRIQLNEPEMVQQKQVPGGAVPQSLPRQNRRTLNSPRVKHNPVCSIPRYRNRDAKSEDETSSLPTVPTTDRKGKREAS